MESVDLNDDDFEDFSSVESGHSESEGRREPAEFGHNDEADEEQQEAPWNSGGDTPDDNEDLEEDWRAEGGRVGKW